MAGFEIDVIFFFIKILKKFEQTSNLYMPKNYFWILKYIPVLSFTRVFKIYSKKKSTLHAIAIYFLKLRNTWAFYIKVIMKNDL